MPKLSRYSGLRRYEASQAHRCNRGDNHARFLRTVRTFFFLIILEILTSGVFAQSHDSSLGHGRSDGILIAQAAVSNTTNSPEQVAPQVLPPLPQSEPATASPSPKIPSLEELDQMFKQTSLGEEADEARLHQQWRQLSNEVINNSDLVAARARAEAAPTDFLKRQRLRAYYMMFYDRMRAKAQTPELKNYIDGQKTQHLGVLAQNKVRPSPSPAATAR